MSKANIIRRRFIRDTARECLRSIQSNEFQPTFKDATECRAWDDCFENGIDPDILFFEIGKEIARLPYEKQLPFRPYIELHVPLNYRPCVIHGYRHAFECSQTKRKEV